MTGEIFGRYEELKILEDIYLSKEPEFLAIYGRRRVGKTFLIRTFFEKKNCIFFDITGAKATKLSDQIKHFTKRIGKIFYKGAKLEAGKNWDETFELLTEAINSIEKNQKIVLFFDEFPWMATKNSKLLQNLDYYWNQHWSKDKRVKLIICGSSASWIIDKIVNNKGGLHNRLTHSIYLEPFNLSETKNFLFSKGIKLENRHILQLYMVLGGVPYYLNKIEKGLSATQNIEKLTFRKKSFLLGEFDNLFSSLFSDHEICIDFMREIALHIYGIGQESLLKKIGKSVQGKGGLQKLKSLQDAGFVMSFKPQFHKRKGIYYKVIDAYSLFYFRWIEPIKETLLQKSLTIGYWDKIKKQPAWNSWAGYGFESICYEHLAQISSALNLSPTAIPNTWRYVPTKGSQELGAQIDLLFDRDDDAITVCEIKYTDKPFVIDKEYAAKLLNKVKVFKDKTRTKKQIFIAMISANGIKKTIYSEELISGVVTLEDLFK